MRAFRPNETARVVADGCGGDFRGKGGLVPNEAACPCFRTWKEAAVEAAVEAGEAEAGECGEEELNSCWSDWHSACTPTLIESGSACSPTLIQSCSANLRVYSPSPFEEIRASVKDAMHGARTRAGTVHSLGSCLTIKPL